MSRGKRTKPKSKRSSRQAKKFGKKAPKGPGRPKNTPLSEHFEIDSRLVPPMRELGVEPLEWDRDLIPEYLWLSALALHYGIWKRNWLSLYNELLDAYDDALGITDQHLSTESEKEAAPLGLVSDFTLLSVELHAEFRAKHADTIARAVLNPFGHILSMYPSCPMYWLLPDELRGNDPSRQSESEVGDLRHPLI